MTLKIGDVAPAFEPETTEVALRNPMHMDCAPKEPYQVMARATPCSPMVFHGLLAWARLDAQLPSTAERKPVTRQADYAFMP